MLVSPGGARPAVWFALLVCVSTGTALAQVTGSTPDTRAIPAGPFLLYPIFSTEVERTDNLFFSNRNPIGATVFRATPGIVAKLQMQKSVFDLGYALQYKTYDGADIEANFSHFFRADGDFRFGSGFVVAFTEDFQKGVLDTQTFDPGGEVRFLGDRFTNNRLQVDLGHERGRRAIGMTIGVGGLEFDDQKRLELAEPDNVGRVSGLYDTEGAFARAYVESQRTERLRILAEIVFSPADLARIIRVYELDENGSKTDEFTDFDEDREQDKIRAGGGVRWALSPGSRVDAVLSYTSQQYESRSDLFDQRKSSFHGVVGTASFTSDVPGRPRLAVRVLRDVYPSVYLGSDYYVSNRLSLALDSPARLRVRVGGEVRYYANDYPQSDPAREDSTVDGRLWLGYRMSQAIEWRVHARQVSRSSSLPGLGYDATSFGVTFQIGG